jgi:hypothetical protein
MLTFQATCISCLRFPSSRKSARPVLLCTRSRAELGLLQASAYVSIRISIRQHTRSHAELLLLLRRRLLLLLLLLLRAASAAAAAAAV